MVFLKFWPLFQQPALLTQEGVSWLHSLHHRWYPTTPSLRCGDNNSPILASPLLVLGLLLSHLLWTLALPSPPLLSFPSATLSVLALCSDPAKLKKHPATSGHVAFLVGSRPFWACVHSHLFWRITLVLVSTSSPLHLLLQPPYVASVLSSHRHCSYYGH